MLYDSKPKRKINKLTITKVGGFFYYIMQISSFNALNASCKRKFAQKKMRKTFLRKLLHVLEYCSYL